MNRAAGKLPPHFPAVNGWANGNENFQADSQQRGAISGRVVSESGKPLVNVTVSLSAAGTNSRTTTTDTEGNFRFNGLTNRMYFVSPVSAQGYVPKPLPIEARGPRFRPGDSANFTMLKGGVITGRVTDPEGNPVISIPVSLILVRDSEDNKQLIQVSGLGRQRTTDDRGVYRIYGLQPGTYLVAANPNSTGGMSQFSPYVGQTPTYHPSATRDTAIHVKVDYGSEASGIDIRFRAETGRTISGKVTGSSLTINNIAGVSLISATNEAQVSSEQARPTEGQHVFSIPGLTDGEYILTSTFFKPDTEEVFSSTPRRVAIKGADVTGLTLSLIPMAGIFGRVVVEKSPTVCDAKLTTALSDVSLTARRAEKTGDLSVTLPRFAVRGGSTDGKGEFKLNNLTPGHHRLTAFSRNENWYVKSIHAAPTGLGRSSIVADLVRSGVVLKPGERLTGVTVAVTEGAASISGKLAAAREGEKLPQRARIYVVPGEPAAAENLLRYIEIQSFNGTYNLTGLAPGKYWLLAKPIAVDDQTFPPPVAWDAIERAKLRKEAEAAKNEIELKVCQRVKDHVLRLP
ncbi:MAG: carboxypeptidase-like regulatory domain-containing protein [Acidobacteriota bacterium]|nr:carboxypeptidase-like regulatory domain-containing protein [Acidobacteriota bacterium]